MKKIGIIGSGIVGQTLAAGFLKHGYSVLVGTSDPGKLEEWKNGAGKGAAVGSFKDAAAFGELVVLAVKGTAAVEAVQKADPSLLAGKTVIDTTNPIADIPPQNGVLTFFTDFNESLLEKLQKAFPTVHFVKSFSCVGSSAMIQPQFAGGPPTMFYCGNDESAKSEVKTILGQFGWDSEDMGTAEAARGIEPLCILWCIPGFQKNDWVHAFKMLRNV
jgi:8-hydroxy-5-deazaflavin:NADPH oxidoreductase